MVQRGHSFAIVDEVDSILIDEARTPLIISGKGEESDEMYLKADAFVSRLTPFRIKEMESKESYDDIDADYIIEEKNKHYGAYLPRDRKSSKSVRRREFGGL